MSNDTSLDKLIERYWDDTIDGDPQSLQDVESFAEPFLYTETLKQQAS